MPPVYRFTEIVVYSLLNFLPFLALALYPFRHSLRFSKGVTGILIGLLSVIQVLLGVWVSFVPGNHAAIASALSTALYAAFYFLAVKKHFGKTLFTLLMLFAVEIILSVPIFLYMKSVFTPAVEKEPSGFEWRYLWLIPTTFYIIWYFAIYSVVSRSALEIALRPKNTLFLFIINVGAILIYYVVTRLILEQNTTLELKEKNHQLSMQAVQYENLQEKITDARRAKHDVRHHITLMQEYLASGELDALREYLSSYNDSLPDDSLVRFCENAAANAVLLYFAQQAKDNDIDYIVKADIPSDIFVSDTGLSVLFGNLIENALDACREETSDDRKIVICARQTGNALCITIDNTFTGALRRTTDNEFLSTKHKGLGLGTQSVKSIAEQYGGICRFEVKDGMFCASVMCNKR